MDKLLSKVIDEALSQQNQYFIDAWPKLRTVFRDCHLCVADCYRKSTIQDDAFKCANGCLENRDKMISRINLLPTETFNEFKKCINSCEKTDSEKYGNCLNNCKVSYQFKLFEG